MLSLTLRRAPSRRLVSLVAGTALVLSAFAPIRFAQAVSVPANQVQNSTFAFRISNTSAYSVVSNQPTGVASFSNGAIAGYPEGACIPFVVDLKNNSNAVGDIAVTLVYDYYDDFVGVSNLEEISNTTGTLLTMRSADNLNDIAVGGNSLASLTSVMLSTGSTTTALSAGPYAGDAFGGTDTVSGTDPQRHYNVTIQDIPAKTTAHLYFCGRLGLDASEFNGASLSIGVTPPDGGVENTPINPNQVLELPSLTLTKIVSGGEATADAWSFIVDGNAYDIADGETSVVVSNLSPDGEHSVVESGPDGYSFDSGEGVNCVFDGQGGATATVAAGNPATDASCTFTNVFEELPPEPAYVRIEKTVINDDGGELGPEDFDFTLDGDAATLNMDIEVEPGTYTVGESVNAGYSAFFGGACSEDGSVTAVAGQTALCSITNDDIAPLLTVTKVVVNDDEGQSEVSDFTLYVGETEVTSGASNAFAAGSYVVSEGESEGYAATYSGDCDAEGNVDLGLGEEKSCTITNNDIAVEPTTGFITVTKVVIGGELEVSDFDLFVGEVQMTSGESEEFLAGSYVVSEDGAPNYEAEFSGDCDADGAITLSAEGDLECVITNTYVEPPAPVAYLTVEKIVINDDGGELDVDDFTFYIGETEVTLGEANELSPGSYTVSEDGSEDYVATFSGACDSTGLVELSADEEATCTITNDDIEEEEEPEPVAYLTVEKIVINDDGGELGPDDFTYFIGETEVTLGEANELSPGSYVVSEGFNGAYAAIFSGACDSTGLVELSADEEATCTITNDDIEQEQPPGGGGGGGGGGSSQSYITVVTKIINDDGGTMTPANALMTIVDGGATLIATFGGTDSPGMTGSYTVSGYSVDGSTLAGYSKSIGANCSGSLYTGQSVTCLITYDDNAPSAPPAPEPEPPAPTPQVLGETDETPVEPPAPVPQVLGVTDEQLPRTGFPIAPLLALSAMAAVTLRRRA